MTPPPRTRGDADPAARAARIRAMFGRLVPQYDRMNRLMTLGLDGRWRRQGARAAQPAGGRVLDLGSGTGDLARELLAAGALQVVGLDFARPMLARASAKPRLAGDARVHWVQGDALRLPFPDASFAAVTSGFLLRNLVDLESGLAEMLRVLAPGGRLVALDVTHPQPGPAGALVRVGFEQGITRLAGWLSGDREAYRYLPSSLAGFPTAPELVRLLEDLDAHDVRFRRLGIGNIALHLARKG